VATEYLNKIEDEMPYENPVAPTEPDSEDELRLAEALI